jgi:uncharacterized protein (DUF433 family)
VSILLHADPLPLRVDETGTVRVGQSRVTLDVLVQYWRHGMPPEEIARNLDTLSLADILGALAYYVRHQPEMDDYLSRRAREAEYLRQQIEAANAKHLAALKARVDALRSQQNGGHVPTANG